MAGRASLWERRRRPLPKASRRPLGTPGSPSGRDPVAIALPEVANLEVFGAVARRKAGRDASVKGVGKPVGTAPKNREVGTLAGAGTRPKRLLPQSRFDFKRPPTGVPSPDVLRIRTLPSPPARSRVRRSRDWSADRPAERRRGHPRRARPRQGRSHSVREASRAALREAFESGSAAAPEGAPVQEPERRGLERERQRIRYP